MTCKGKCDKYKAYKPVGTGRYAAGQKRCFDQQTRLVTTNGLVQFNKIKKSDQIFTFDGNQLKIVNPSKIIIQKHDGQMIKLKGKRYDLLVTPYHKMLLYNKSKTELTFVEAKELKRKTRWNFPKFFTKFPISAIDYLIGIHLGDGAVVMHKQRGTIIPEWHIFIPKNDHSRKRVEKSLTNIGLDFYSHDGGLVVKNKHGLQNILAILKRCKKYARNKKVPREFMTDEHINGIFEGLMDSDGNKDRSKFTTLSEELKDNFVEICQRLGIDTSVWHLTRLPTIHKGNIIRKRKIWSIGLSSEFKTITKINIKEVNYKGIVWCLTVPKYHNFLVERNGKYMITGNCQACEIFLTWEGLWCPCCGFRLRCRPRNIKYKAVLRRRNGESELIEDGIKNVKEIIDNGDGTITVQDIKA